MSKIPLRYPEYVAQVDVCPKPIISCRFYIQNIRYRLSIKYNCICECDDELVVILMNPSKATMNKSDGTINNVISYLCGSYKYLTIFNLNPFYDSAPKKLVLSDLNSVLQSHNLNYIEQYITTKSIKNILFAFGKCGITLNKKDKKIPQLVSNRPIIESFFKAQKQRIFARLYKIKNITFYSYGEILDKVSAIHFSPINEGLGRLENRKLLKCKINFNNGEYEIMNT